MALLPVILHAQSSSTTGVIQGVAKDGVHGFEQYAVGEAAVGALAHARGGILTSPLADVAPSLYRTSSSFPSTYARKFNLGAEYGLGKDTSISVEASHIRGFHLPRIRNVLGDLPPQYELEQTCRSDYLGATVSLNRRMSRELTYLVAYSAGRTKDDGSDFDEQPVLCESWFSLIYLRPDA